MLVPQVEPLANRIEQSDRIVTYHEQHIVRVVTGEGVLVDAQAVDFATGGGAIGNPVGLLTMGDVGDPCANRVGMVSTANTSSEEIREYSFDTLETP